jgi:hypothetical protein
VQGSTAPAEDTAVSQARALFNEGTERAQHGDWSQALPAFERSSALRPHAVTTYSIGYCERALGQIVRARKTLGKALAESAARGGELPDDLTTAAKTYLAELERRVARAVIRLSPEDASVLVDGRPLERATTDGPQPVLWAGTRDLGPAEPAPAARFELPLDPGVHVLIVAKEGYANEVTTRTFEPGSEVQLDLKLSPAQQLAPGSPGPGAEGAGTGARSRVPLNIALGVGGAGLITGAVAGGIALGQAAKVRDTCSASHACTGTGSTYLSRADTAADVATVGFIVGGVGAAAAGVIWWMSAKGAGASAEPPASAASKASARGGLRDVRVTPWVTWGGGGVTGTF